MPTKVLLLPELVVDLGGNDEGKKCSMDAGKNLHCEMLQHCALHWQHKNEV